MKRGPVGDWEEVSPGVFRLVVTNGWIYIVNHEGGRSCMFVPDVDRILDTILEAVPRLQQIAERIGAIR